MLLLCMILGACIQNSPPTRLAPTPSMTVTVLMPTPVPTLTSTAIPTHTSTSLNLHPQIVVPADHMPEPDDLVLAPDGSIYISDVAAGTIQQYTSSGQLNLILSNLSSPEGMAFLPDGSMIIAEQGKNRLIRYDLQTKSLTPFFDLVNHTNQLGVDGILWDGTSLIVPDSPNGIVLQVSPDGKTLQQLTSGLVRPTGAFAEPMGSLLIPDEYGNAVFRLHPDGALEKVADLPIPDDVIADTGGNIFVVTLGDDAIHVLLADTHQDLILVSGLNQPQGIILNTDGNLIVTDSGNHRLIKILIH